jgi:MerR family redox-sensitive transcriptional activator SoxR
MTIGQVAKAAGLRTSAIRYYERYGLLPQPRRAKGQRQYDSLVLERLALVRFATDCGFKLSEARTLLAGSVDGPPLSERLRDLGADKLLELEAEERRIALRKRRITRALRCCCADLAECGRIARRAMQQKN